MHLPIAGGLFMGILMRSFGWVSPFVLILLSAIDRIDSVAGRGGSASGESSKQEVPLIILVSMMARLAGTRIDGERKKHRI
jgi:hypothetical protein